MALYNVLCARRSLELRVVARAVSAFGKMTGEALLARGLRGLESYGGEGAGRVGSCTLSSRPHLVGETRCIITYIGKNKVVCA